MIGWGGPILLSLFVPSCPGASFSISHLFHLLHSIALDLTMLPFFLQSPSRLPPPFISPSHRAEDGAGGFWHLTAAMALVRAGQDWGVRGGPAAGLSKKSGSCSHLLTFPHRHFCHHTYLHKERSLSLSRCLCWCTDISDACHVSCIHTRGVLAALYLKGWEEGPNEKLLFW